MHGARKCCHPKAAARTVYLAGRSNTAWSIDAAMPASPLISIALMLLAAEPAQSAVPPQGSDAELESLIPDAAVRDPESWAKVAPPPAESPSATASADEPVLDPSSPMSADADFRLPWPDESLVLPELVSLTPDPDMAAFVEAETATPLDVLGDGDELRISPRAVLVVPPDPLSLPMRAAIAERFAALSTIEALSGEGSDNPAQLAARARRDGDLLRRLLRSYGYFDAEISQAIGTAAKPEVRFQIIPGPRYAIGAVALGDIGQ